jgi:hypothetical protein
VNGPCHAAARFDRLRADLTSLLDDAVGLLGPEAHATLAGLRQRLGQPLTIAVAGHTNAGKSTLVNALIESRVAPTKQTECTRQIAWFRSGPQPARVVCHDGRKIQFPLTPQGRIPDNLIPDVLPDGVGQEQVDRIEVWLDSEKLVGEATVIDTPGLSGDPILAEPTQALLTSGDVDVLLFVLGPEVRATERAALDLYLDASKSLYNGLKPRYNGLPVNALGVLSQPDRYFNVPDPWAAAQARAERHTADLAPQLSGVLPVMGKIAETIETEGFDRVHASYLQQIVALEPSERDDVLDDAATFVASDILTPSARRELYDRLDIYGIRKLTEMYGPRMLSEPATHAPVWAAQMHEALSDMSGIDALRRRIRILYLRPAVVHKAVRILSEVRSLSRGMPKPARDTLRKHIEEIRDSPAMHTYAELEALTALYNGSCALPTPSNQEPDQPPPQDRVLRLFEGDSPAERLGKDGADPPQSALHDAALAETRFWAKYGNAINDLRIKEVARTAKTSAELIIDCLRAQP